VIKNLVEAPLEVRYEEDADGLMRRTCILAMLSIERTRGELLFRQMEATDRNLYVLVFGWRIGEEMLDSGMVRVRVETLTKLQKEVLGPEILARTEGRLFFW